MQTPSKRGVKLFFANAVVVGTLISGVNASDPLVTKWATEGHLNREDTVQLIRIVLSTIGLLILRYNDNDQGSQLYTPKWLPGRSKK